MNLSSIRIVLVSTSHPGNIGSTARAMKTMGLDKLYLVSPKMFPDQKAYEMAAGAETVLHQAIITSSLDEALNGCQLIIATSARTRGIALPHLLPAHCAELIASKSEKTAVAIVFGRESTGLTNEELLRCHYQVVIPSNPEYSSLNLSQAVQIIAYELRLKLLAPTIQAKYSRDHAATAEEIEQFYQHLAELMTTIDFLKPSNPRRLMQRIRRLFNRTQLEHMEVNILRGILSQIQYALSRSNSS